MSAVVQATCPGCKRQLRIPADWARRPVRCKHCGFVLNSKDPAPATGEQPRTVKTPHRPPAEAVAAPVPRTTTSSPASPFDDLYRGEAAVRSRRRHPVWRALLVGILLVLLGSALGATGYLLRTGIGGGRLTLLGAKADGNPPDTAPSAPVADGNRPQRQGVVLRDQSVAFPRRALVISVHDYLFANPVGAGTHLSGGHKVADFPDRLSKALRIPRNQVAHLSDAAAGDHARPPLRPVIEETLTKFLESSREQDRVIVFFVGHAAESGNQAYLVPLEGELDRPETLIPLRWVYEQLAKCRAKQRVLVLDVCRSNPVAGSERPGGEPMGPNLAAALREPPKGVQVWSACGPGQNSFETENDPMGVFLDELMACLERVGDGKLKVQDRIQQPDDLFPLDGLKGAVDALVAKEVGPQKLAQETVLSGAAPEGVPAFEPAEPPPPPATIADGPPPLPPEKKALLTKVLAEVATPPVKRSSHEDPINFAALRFDPKTLEPYLANAGKETELRKTVARAQALLYAVAGVRPPPGLEPAVAAAKKTLKGNLSILKDGFRAPKNEAAFKNQVLEHERDVARIMAKLNAAHEEMEGVAEQRSAEPKRWQANYDFLLARLEAEIAYLYEYQSMLGQMRKELPPRNRDLHGGWKLAATTTLTGDSVGKRTAAASRKTYDKIAKEHAGTPWAVLAKREKLTALGLEWKPVR